MTNTKGQGITDVRTPQDIEKDKNRGKVLLWIYVGLVIALVVVYLALHGLVPADIKQLVVLDARDKSLESITRAEIVISATEVDVETVSAKLTELGGTITETLGITGTQAAQIADAFKEVNEKIKKKALQDQKTDFKEELDILTTEVTKTVGIDVDRVTKLIEKMEEQNKKDDPNSGVLKVHLEDLKDEITKRKIVGRYFWSTGWLKWLELFFWALLGTFFHALMKIQKGLRLVETRAREAEFRKETAGYINMTIRGPFVALFLIFALSTVEFKVANVGIDLTTAPIHVLIFLAGVLGLFSRVAYKQLELIVGAMLPKAWAFVHPEELSIVPPTASVAFGETKLFKVEPKRDVKWDIWPDDLGSIDAAGKYTAPKKGDPPGAVVGAPVTVRATLKDEPSIVDTAKVTLYEKFDVKGDAEVEFSAKSKYSVKPAQEGGVTWSIEPQWGEITEEGEYTAPKEGEPPEAKAGEEVTIKATRKEEPKVSSSMKVKLVKGT